jgi:hypothetical protein
MTNRNRVRLSQLSLGLAIALAAAPAFAQNTSANIGGRIVSGDSEPVTGAQVTIVHTPSGTVSNAVSGADGRYAARGLRVGGPYTITIVKDGVTEVREGVYLQLAETTSVDATLGQSTTTLAAVEVTGVAGGSEVFSSTNFGTGTSISQRQLNTLPSIQRDLQDYARLDPRLSQTDKERGEISAGGQNTRYNSITVDSVSINDTFGLESNNLPTIRQPISIDAIEAVQVNIANYDTTQRGYTGANINAVTKSGTNEFKGSVYGTYRSNDWVREEDDRGVIFNRFDTEETYGATFGGPIAKDTLFFFLNYEKTTLGGIAPDLASGPFGRGAITQTDIDNVRNEAIAQGFIPGDLGSTAPGTEVETILGRVDWNISDDHRLAFRFSTTDQTEAILPGFGFNFLSLSSYWYDQEKTIDNYVVELFSDWTDSFSTEARVSLRQYESVPVVFARQPQVQVDFSSSVNMRFGTEQFRHANVLETDTLNAFFAGNLFLGDHEVKFGVDHEQNDIYNLFLESNFGTYRFSSFTNFQNGIYRDYALRVSPTGNPADSAADFTLENTGLFVQDTWAVNYNLTLNYGFRYDIANADDAVPYNAGFNTAFGLRNDETVDGSALFQPRVGFNYTFDSERQTQLRGGIGLFQGAAANVWLSNSYTNNGLTIDVYGCGTGFNTNCTGAPLPSSDPDNQPQFGSARADVDLLEPGFEQPSVWKANLAFDHELPFGGLVVGAELLLTKVDAGIYYEHINLGTATQPGLDGRNMYWASTDPSLYTGSFFGPASNARAGSNPDYREVLVARNTDKGRGENFTLSLEKPFDPENNWSWMVAYSYTDATEVNGLTSSRAISNWRSHAAFNVNENVDSRSAYVNRDRFLATTGYRLNLFGDYKTQISMFYEGRRGKPYSWVFNNDMNGDGQAGNDLMYIPNVGEVRFTNPTEEAAFWEIVNRNGLAGFKGSAVPRNSDTAPWVNSFDVRISQELPGFFKGNKAEIWLDILNVGNLLNKDWGLIDEIGFQSDGGQARSFVNFAGIDPVTGQYVYDVVSEENFIRRDNRGESRWAAQLGFRYSF